MGRHRARTSTAPDVPKRKSRVPRALAVGLIVAHATLALTAAWVKNATFDEVSHLPAGFTYLAWGDYRLNPEHPPLVKLIAAAPLVAAGAGSPGRDSASFSRGLELDEAQWVFGQDFLYLTPGNDADRLLFLARLPMVGISVLLGAILWLWASELFGEIAAVAVLALWAFDPNLLGHGPLVTTDVAVATFACGLFYLLWRAGRRLSAAAVVGAGVLAGLAASSKFTALGLAPAVVLVLAIHVARPQEWPVHLHGRAFAIGGWRRKSVAALGVVLVIGVLAGSIVWATYRFRFAPTPEPGRTFPVAERLAAVERGQGGSVALLARAAGWAERHRLLPQAYCYGLIASSGSAGARSAYLHGELSTTGWWYYFPLAIGLKTPLPTLIAVLAAVWLLIRRKGPPGVQPWDLGAVVGPGLLFLGLALTSRLDIGVRHVFPVYPFLYLLAGVAFSRWLADGRLSRVTAGALMSWLVLAALFVHPHYLAYFNELAGGPAGGVRWLADSNLDWGQDLRLLKRWMDERGVRWINLCYFGSAEPEYYGIDFVALPGWQPANGAPTRPPRVPGLLAISATSLVGIPFDARTHRYYQDLLRRATLVDTVGHSIHVYALPAGSAGAPEGESH